MHSRLSPASLLLSAIFCVSYTAVGIIFVLTGQALVGSLVLVIVAMFVALILTATRLRHVRTEKAAVVDILTDRVSA